MSNLPDLEEWIEERPALEQRLHSMGSDLTDYLVARILCLKSQNSQLLAAIEKSTQVLEALTRRVEEVEARLAELDDTTLARQIREKGKGDG